MHIDDQYGAAISTVWSAMRELVAANPQCVLPLNEVVRLHKLCSSTKLVTAPGAVPAALQLEVLKKLCLVQLISHGAVSAPSLLSSPSPNMPTCRSRILKNPVYNELINAYPQNAERLHTLPDKEKQMFSSDRNLGLVTQDIDRAPRWTLMARHSKDEVRALGISMIETDDISAQISALSTVTFSNWPPQISKDEVDTGLFHDDTATRAGPSTRAIASSSSQSDRADGDGPPAHPRPRKQDKCGPHGQRDLTKTLSASAATSAMHSIVVVGIQAQLLSNWTVLPSIGQMELIFNGGHHQYHERRRTGHSA
ncbi:hypothetical protein B0H14DRAFT_3638789 [Mycena olivaceomarginata]|nr:hypothetical protein B0H14DRAFT_3638789 [Mycena olivaceomarginata]